MENQKVDVVATLPTNGLTVPGDFPTIPYGLIYEAVVSKYAAHPLYEHYAGAWNALGYRFRACIDSGDAFASLIKTHGATPLPEDRYLQEKALFDFFSSGFSVFESAFYGLYTIGAFLAAGAFPLASEREQQQVSPTRTKDAFAREFPTDPIVAAFSTLFADPEYQKWREVRNVLTHRTAPGRRIYVSIGNDNVLPTEWKLNDSPLDISIATNGRRELGRLLTHLLDAGAQFVEAKFK